MLATILATARLLRALGRALADPATRGVVILAVMILAGGTAFYSGVEGWSAVDALYFSFVTLTTIGYGDLVPTSPGAKIFTVIYSLVGIGVIASFVTALALATIRGGQERGDRRHGRRRSPHPDANDGDLGPHDPRAPDDPQGP